MEGLRRYILFAFLIGTIVGCVVYMVVLLPMAPHVESIPQTVITYNLGLNDKFILPSNDTIIYTGYWHEYMNGDVITFTCVSRSTSLSYSYTIYIRSFSCVFKFNDYTIQIIEYNESGCRIVVS